MAVAFLETVPQPLARQPLTEADAVAIWIARWLRIRRKDLVRRYGCDPRRLYEIWEGERFPDARAKALELFEARYPEPARPGRFRPPPAARPGAPSGPAGAIRISCSGALRNSGTPENSVRTNTGQIEMICAMFSLRSQPQ